MEIQLNDVRVSTSSSADNDIISTSSAVSSDQQEFFSKLLEHAARATHAPNIPHTSENRTPVLTRRALPTLTARRGPLESPTYHSRTGGGPGFHSQRTQPQQGLGAGTNNNYNKRVNKMALKPTKRAATVSEDVLQSNYTYNRAAGCWASVLVFEGGVGCCPRPLL